MGSNSSVGASVFGGVVRGEFRGELNECPMLPPNWLGVTNESPLHGHRPKFLSITSHKLG